MSEEKIDSKLAKPMFYDPQVRRIRSFVTRAGRVSSGQQRAIESFAPIYCIDFEKKLLDYQTIFSREAPTIFEIGFGMGETTASIAQSHPQTNFIAVEVHTPGVGNLLKLIDEKKLNNIRIIQHDAVEILEHMIPQNSLDGVHIFFPDPWHKAKHNKRRLIQPEFVKFLATRICPNGYLHCATDWENYAEQMLEVLNAEKALINTAEGFAPRPDYRPVTKFEKRGLRLGHGVWDVLFRKHRD